MDEVDIVSPELVVLVLILVLMVAVGVFVVTALRRGVAPWPVPQAAATGDASRLEARVDELARTTAQMSAVLAQMQRGSRESALATARDGAAVQRQIADTREALGQLQEGVSLLREQVGAQAARTSGVAQNQARTLEAIRQGVADVNAVMTDKKARGAWGEYQLASLLEIYGGSSRAVYELQYTLSRGQRVDAALHLPGSSKVLGIDSKFPLEAYRELMAAEDLEPGPQRTDAIRGAAARFRTSVRKHIDDVARKYVVPPETADLACLFVPSEAVYTQICADEPELVSYAAEKHVLITSPTTLVGVIFALVSATRDFDRARNIDEVVRRIGLLQDDVRRLNARLDAAAKALDTCQQRFSDVHVSGSKIVRDIEKLASGTLE